jgi:HAMP domain-containing protein
MRLDRRLFRSTLAHRVFLAFVTCALLPIVVLAVVSNRSVTDQLMNQAGERLRQVAKSQGLSLYERLLFAEAELDVVAERFATDPGGTGDAVAMQRLRSVELMDADRAVDADEDRGRGATEMFCLRQRGEHLANGRAVLMPIMKDRSPSPIRLARRLEAVDPSSEMLVGELDPTYLWGLDGGNAIPANAEYCVFEANGELIYGSFGGCRNAWPRGSVSTVGDDDGEPASEFAVETLGGLRFVAGWRELFLEARFGAANWMIVVCEPRSIVLAPVARWRVLFPAVVLLALWIVLLLVIFAIRRTLDPIDDFRDATERISRGEFDHHVELRSGDEFEALARAFNAMSDQLRRQFGALATTAKTHRAILSSLETSQVVSATIDGLLDYFGCDRAVVAVRDARDGGVVRTSADVAAGDRGDDVTTVVPDAGPLTTLASTQPGVILGHDEAMTSTLRAWLGLEDLAAAVAVPVRQRGAVEAVLGLGFADAQVLSETDLDQLTQIGDQFAVALSNARMVAEIHDFSTGTLEALARAVDAKSPWTAGHSERVTLLAVAIGKALGIDSTELFRLYRGAMLHDMGKLGIPQKILDKRGRLDHGEFSIVKTHTIIGERILEPIGAFAEIMPVVTQHHERYDGSGYPVGLVGEEIDLKARILAVADVYDAMTNPRPYRESVAPHEVVAMISAQAGTQFDPTVVSAFLSIIDAHGGVENLDWTRSGSLVLPAFATDRPRTGAPPTGKVT